MQTKPPSRATRRAQGQIAKEGAIRRVEVTMEEELFLRLRDRALTEGRSLSGQVRFMVAQVLEASK